MCLAKDFVQTHVRAIDLSLAFNLLHIWSIEACLICEYAEHNHVNEEHPETIQAEISENKHLPKIFEIFVVECTYFYDGNCEVVF